MSKFSFEIEMQTKSQLLIALKKEFQSSAHEYY